MRTWLILAVACLIVTLLACSVFAVVAVSFGAAASGGSLFARLGPATPARPADLAAGRPAVSVDPSRPAPAGGGQPGGTASGDTEPGSPAGPAPAPDASPAPQPAAGLAGRLVAVADDGNIVIVRPDGSARQPLTSDAGPEHGYRQPTWAPDAGRVAWVEVDDRGAEVQSALLTSRPDGAGRTKAVTGSPPFYLYWSPDGGRLAYLANGAAGLDLGLVTPQGIQDPAATLDQGSPFYFAWAPDGQRMLVHVGEDRLALLDLRGQHTTVPHSPGPFTAPQWSSDGQHLLYVAAEDGQQARLLASAPDAPSTAAQEVLRVEGTLTFGLSPDNRRVAYVETRVPVDMAAFGHLFVTGLDGGAPQEISQGPVLAFWWSPDGARLLFLTLESKDAPGSARPAAWHPQQSDAPDRLQWHVWDGARTLDFAYFLPSSTFLTDYLRFFDQYNRSMTLWSPDGRAFVYAGSIGQEADAVWVQPVGENVPARRVLAGSMAAWSPR